MSANTDKDDLRQLREARKPQIDRAKNMIKTQAALIKAIRGQLVSGARTVPQIAAAAGIESSQVLLYVAGLRKYGIVAEGQKDGDYFTYMLASKTDA